MDGTCCNDCRYFLRVNAEEGECRRFPPQQLDLNRHAIYPRMQCTDQRGCGEYKSAAPEPIPEATQ